MNQLTDFKLNTCEIEYAKDPKIKRENIKELITWIQKQHHMPDVKEYTLIQFYYVSDYSLHRTKNLLELFYKFKNDAPELFIGGIIGPPRFQYNIWDVSYQFDISSMKTSDGSRLLYWGLKDFDPVKYSHEATMAVFMKIMFITIIEQGTCSGILPIFDAQGCGLRHLAALSISLARKSLYFVQEVMPVKVKSVHVIHIHPIVDKFMIFLKPFIKKELFNKIHLHSDINEFYDMVGKENVPINLGGTLPFTTDELNEFMKIKFDAFSDIVDEELQQKTDESKRIEKNAENPIDINGSFRLLEID